jgi:uncharacterized protein YkwD
MILRTSIILFLSFASITTFAIRYDFGQGQLRGAQDEGEEGDSIEQPPPAIARPTPKPVVARPALTRPVYSDGCYGDQVCNSINQLRAQHGVPPLRLDASLSRVAQQWAQQMARAGNIYHGNFGSRVGSVAGGSATENVAVNGAGPSAVAMQWYHSQKGHRENMLRRDMRRIGVGQASGFYNGRPNTFWCADFSN